MSPPLTIRGPWLALVQHAGSVSALAEAIGVTRRTLHRWIAGTSWPGPFTRAYVDNLAARHDLPTPFGGK